MLSAPTQLHTSQVFRAKRERDAAALGPLDAACQWAAEHARQTAGGDAPPVATPMLVLNEEMQSADRPWRQFVATEITTFVDAARGRRTPMFYHEVPPTDAPVKLAFDLEMSIGDAALLAAAETVLGVSGSDAVRAECDRLAALLVDTALQLLAPLAERALERRDVVHLDASRADKWSSHWVFDCSDASGAESLAFASQRDCYEFVQRVLAQPALAAHADAYARLVDRGIYATRHPLRTYYSAKRGAETHWFRDASVADRDAPCDAGTLVRSLRTAFVVHNAAGEFYHQSSPTRYVTSLYLLDDPSALAEQPIRLCARPALSALSTPATARLGAAADGTHSTGLLATLVAAPELAVYEPTVARFRDANTVMITCRGTACSAHEAGAHRRGHQCVYLRVDLLRRQYTQLCHSASCHDRRLARPARGCGLSAEVCSVIEDYLASDDWSPGVVVGAQFAAALGRQ